MLIVIHYERNKLKWYKGSLEESKTCSLLISISTYGRVKNDLNAHNLTLLVTPHEWKKGVCQFPILKATSNSVSTILFKIPDRWISATQPVKKSNVIRSNAFSYTVDSLNPYSITFLSREDFALEEEGKYLAEKQGLFVKDFDETYQNQAQPNGWSIIYKYIFSFFL